MIDHPATLMFAGAAIGATVTCLWFTPRFRALTRHFDDLTARAAQAGLDLTAEAERHAQVIGRLNAGASELRRIRQKLDRAKETLTAASAQNTMAAARKVIAEGQERVRCAGETEPQ